MEKIPQGRDPKEFPEEAGQLVTQQGLLPGVAPCRRVHTVHRAVSIWGERLWLNEM